MKSQHYPWLDYDPALAPRLWSVYADTLTPEQYRVVLAEKIEKARQWFGANVHRLDEAERGYLSVIAEALTWPGLQDGAMDRFMLFVSQFNERSLQQEQAAPVHPNAPPWSLPDAA